jgi:hypothetical protein
MNVLRDATFTYCGPSPRSRHRLKQARLTWIFSESWISFSSDSVVLSLWLAAGGRTDREANPRSVLGQFDPHIPGCYAEGPAFEAEPNWESPLREAMTDSTASRFAFMRIWL